MKKRFFDIARVASKKSSSEPQMGCAVIRKGRVVSFGWNNKAKTHPRSKTHSNRIHAELHAIIGVSQEELRGAAVYVYREYKDGTPALSKPCAFCQAALREAGVKIVFFTTKGGFDSMRLDDEEGSLGESQGAHEDESEQCSHEGLDERVSKKSETAQRA